MAGPSPRLLAALHSVLPATLGATIFVAAVVVSALQRGLARAHSGRGRVVVRPGAMVRVCFAARASDDWRGAVLSFLRSAAMRSCIRVGVLLQCREVGEAEARPDDLRTAVDIHHTVPIGATRHGFRAAKLVRHFVNGLETRVVLVDPRATFQYAWDRHLAELPPSVGEDVLVTCPLSPHAAGFPTLRRRSTGEVVRSEARPMRFEQAGVFVPAVCACSELIAASPAVLLAWRREWKAARASRAASAPPFPGAALVPAFPLLDPLVRPEEEEEVLVNNEGIVFPAALSSAGKLGLSPRAGSQEMYHKYGSTTSARLAVRLDRRG